MGHKMLDSLTATTRKEAFEEAIAGIKKLHFAVPMGEEYIYNEMYETAKEFVLQALRDENKNI